MTTPVEADWQQREQPSFQLSDLHDDVYNDGFTLYGGDHADAAPLIEWINEYRAPLHRILRQTQPFGLHRLQDYDIRLRDIIQQVAEVTDTPPYPLRRVLPNDTDVLVRAYREAVQTVTPARSFAITKAIFARNTILCWAWWRSTGGTLPRQTGQA